GAAGRVNGQADGSEKIYQKTLKSTVWVVVPVGKDGNKLKVKSGTGSLIDANRRLILTNYHVVEGSDKEVFVLFPTYEKGKPGAVRQVYRKQFSTSGKDGKDSFKVDARVVETQSPVNSGDSGGPVVNDQGELVAVVQGHAPDAQARLVSYFIDVSEVKALMAE